MADQIFLHGKKAFAFAFPRSDNLDKKPKHFSCEKHLTLKMVDIAGIYGYMHERACDYLIPSCTKQHIHWHFIVPGGGLTKDGNWVDLPYNDKFIFPPKAMSRVIRARFIKLFKKAYYDGKIAIPDSREDLKHPAMFEYFLNDLASDKWVNYAKRPFGGPEQVVKYIGRYTHRVAISNNRLIDIEGGKIRFWVKNYKKGGRKENMELPADLFIQRFLWHILPKRFRKIRYGGFLARPVREEKLELARQALAMMASDTVHLNGACSPADFLEGDRH